MSQFWSSKRGPEYSPRLILAQSVRESSSQPLPRVPRLRAVDGGEHVPLGAVGGGGGRVTHVLERVRHRRGVRGAGAGEHRVQHVVEPVHLGETDGSTLYISRPTIHSDVKYVARFDWETYEHSQLPFTTDRDAVLFFIHLFVYRILSRYFTSECIGMLVLHIL